MASSIATMSAKITADASGLKAVTDRARADIAGLAQTGGSFGGGGGGFGALLNVGKQFAGPLAAIGSVTGLVSAFQAATKAADDWLNKADAVEVSVEQFQRISVSAQEAGTSAEAVFNAMSKSQRAIADALTGSKEPTEALQAMGLSASQLIEMSPEDAFAAIAAGLDKIGSSAVRTGAEMALLGKAGPQLRLVLKDLAGGLGKWDDQIVSERSLRTIDRVGDAIAAMQRRIKSAGMEILATLLTGLGLGDRVRTQSEIAAQAEREAAARRKAADETKRQADEAARLKSIEEGRKQRQSFAEDLRSQTDTVMRGGDDIGRKAEEARQSALAEYRQRLAEANKTWDQQAADQAFRSYSENVRIIDEEVSARRESLRVQKEAEDYARRRNELESTLTSQLRATMEPAERLAEIQQQLATAHRIGIEIKPWQEGRILQRAQEEAARAMQAKEASRPKAEGLERGTAAEYEERIRLMEQRNTDAQQAAQLQQQQLQAQKETNQKLSEVRQSIDRMLDSRPKVYVAMNPN